MTRILVDLENNSGNNEKDLRNSKSMFALHCLPQSLDSTMIYKCFLMSNIIPLFFFNFAEMRKNKSKKKNHRMKSITC